MAKSTGTPTRTPTALPAPVALPTPTATPTPPALLLIPQIPGIMAAQTPPLTMGAALMNDWFRRPANSHLPILDTNTTTIQMTWVLGFERAKAAYDKLVSQWATEKAKKTIADKLAKQGKLLQFAKPVAFFDTKPSDPVPDIDKDSIQHEVVGDWLDPVNYGMDDMMAALNMFTLKMAVWGSVSWGVVGGTAKHKVEISTLGIYARDSYDFHGSQSLGHWDATNNSAGFTSLSGQHVTNADFNAWRQATVNRGAGQGGDFLVFSDLKIVPVDPPYVFDIT